MNKVIITPQKLLPILKGHPFIFPRAIQSSTAKLAVGELVQVYDVEQDLLGVGVFNPHSLYRVRMLNRTQQDGAFISLDALVLKRFQQAKNLRTALNLPSVATTGYRFFNSEADGLSGLTIDIYGDYLVLLSSAYWVEANRLLIQRALLSIFPDGKLIWRSQAQHLKKDGWEVEIAADDNNDSVIIRENTLQYAIDFATAQKSGFYFDQRENRAFIRQLAHGKRVLDICCYTGGFALNAALGGAEHVLGIDSSAVAIALAQKNAMLNQLEECVVFEQQNAKDYLCTHQENYDIIILDPPKLSPRREDLKAAGRYYYKLNELAIARLTEEGGFLLTCSCSSAMTADMLAGIVADAAMQQGRVAKLLSEQHAAPDHPRMVSFPEGDYLTALLFYIS